MFESFDTLLNETKKNMELLKMLLMAAKNAGKSDDEIITTEVSAKTLHDLIVMSFADEAFYESSFEISWCGFKCSLDFVADNWETIVDALKNSEEYDESEE